LASSSLKPWPCRAGRVRAVARAWGECALLVFVS
jgi:hypothetical protein